MVAWGYVLLGGLLCYSFLATIALYGAWLNLNKMEKSIAELRQMLVEWKRVKP